MVAVTGTAGKTSVASFTRQIWAHCGHPAAMIGTTGVIAPGRNDYGSLTTPDPVSLHQLLAELADAGVTHAAMEASSHGLDQHRLDGVRLSAAGFTNLGRDHNSGAPGNGVFDESLAIGLAAGKGNEQRARNDPPAIGGDGGNFGFAGCRTQLRGNFGKIRPDKVFDLHGCTFQNEPMRRAANPPDCHSMVNKTQARQNRPRRIWARRPAARRTG
jgi:hypothetical protein